MKTQILVIQGGGEGTHKWYKPFIQALKEQLGDGYEVHFPKMPKEENPDYEPWAGKVDQELKKLSDPVIVLGHSLGGSVFIKYLTDQRRDRKFPAFFLVSSPFWGEPGWEWEEFRLAPGFSQKLESIGKIFIYHSKEDPDVPFYHHHVYKTHLPSAAVRTFDNAGHEMITAVPNIVKDIKLTRSI